MNIFIGLSGCVNGLGYIYEGLHRLGFQNVAVGHIYGVAKLMGLNEKMYSWAFQHEKEGNCNNEVSILIRVVSNILATCSLILHIYNKFVTLWLNCINN